MSEQSMKCKDCVLKHIANAMSYAKEILAGHGIGGTPDHRPDYLGELVNAENHLEHISIELLNRVMALRTAAQIRRMVPVESDIDTLREIWIAVEATEVPEGSITTFSQPINTEDSGSVVTGHLTSPDAKILTNPDGNSYSYLGKEPIKFDSFPDLETMDTVGVYPVPEWKTEENKDKYNIFLKLANKYMVNGKIVEDLSSYDGKYVWVFPSNVFIAKDVDMKRPLAATVSAGRNPSYIMRLVETEKYKEALKAYETKGEEALDKTELPNGVALEDNIMLSVNRKPCCSVKARLNTAKFVRVNEEGWPYMKEIWETI